MCDDDDERLCTRSHFESEAKDNSRMDRLRVVSNFGDRDCGAGEIHTRPRVISKRRDARKARVCVCISPAPQSPSPKLETTRSLANGQMGLTCSLTRKKLNLIPAFSFSLAGGVIKY